MSRKTNGPPRGVPQAISGIAATGKEVTVSGLTISTLVGGRVTEQWTTWDRLGMLVQLGAVPTAAEA